MMNLSELTLEELEYEIDSMMIGNNGEYYLFGCAEDQRLSALIDERNSRLNISLNLIGYLKDEELPF